MNEQQLAAVKLALEALEMVVVDVKTTPTAYEAHRQAITALQSIIEQQPAQPTNPFYFSDERALDQQIQSMGKDE